MNTQPTKYDYSHPFQRARTYYKMHLEDELTDEEAFMRAMEWLEKETRLTALAEGEAKGREMEETLKNIASVTPADAERWGYYETLNKIVSDAIQALTTNNDNN